MCHKIIDTCMQSFIHIDSNSDFTLHNIPFGVYRKPGSGYTACCTRVGDVIVDLHQCDISGLFRDLGLPSQVFLKDQLNDFIALGKLSTREVRKKLQQALQKGGTLEELSRLNPDILIASDRVDMLLPVKIGDYTDFYSSREHATNVGMMFRDPANALLPNWLHLPVGYHGRASSIVVSGTEIKRPKGQTMTEGATQPDFGPTKQLDFELEMAFVIGKNSELGHSIDVNEAEEYIFGLMLFNDWSARDIQKWEYVPLGPFLAKNFASTISPWIVTLDALEPFRVQGPDQNPQPLPYLRSNGNNNYNIHLSVEINPEDGKSQQVSLSNFKYMYWNMSQQLAHHTVNGCNVRVGDIMASGTISGPTPSSYGSMLEIGWKGTKPVQMPDGTERKFIHDGDTVVIRGWCENEGIRIGFGECDGKII